MPDSRLPAPDEGPREFHTTRWSRVILAGDPSQPTAHEALASLCQDYWRPLYYFARRMGPSPEDAQDLTQGFIAGLLEQNGIARANRERGRFRSFLIGAFCHFLANYRRGQSALKRGGDQVLVSLDAESEAGFPVQAIDGMTPELEFERTWALALLERVMGRLREEYAQAERLPLFEAMQPHLSGAAGRPGYARLAQELGMSEGAITMAMHRMRRRYGELLREEIAATVTTPEEVEDELRHLMNVVSGAPLR
jgi:RNA polymerase sigma-70 factor (ECF subfamily)